MIRFQDIEKTYSNGFQAIKKLNLHIKQGDIFGIIGYSGAGKSTLIRLINRLEEPTSGKILIGGENILELRGKALELQRQKIGMIFQHFNLLSSKSAFENIAFALDIAKWDREKAKARALELLELVGLSEKKDFYPSQLSGGQKQRVAIARALANHPKILLCDEATSALDTKNTRAILELLQNIQKKLGITIVLITHQIEVIRAICNKICVIDKGSIVESGLIDEVFSHPKHPITRELIQSLPHHERDLEGHITDSDNVYELVFLDQNQNQPIISQAIKKFGVDINILLADFNNLSTKTLGKMVVKIEGEHLQATLEWLKAQNIDITPKDKNV